MTGVCTPAWDDGAATWLGQGDGYVPPSPLAWKSPGAPPAEGEGKKGKDNRYQSIKIEILLIDELVAPSQPVQLVGCGRRADSTLVPNP